MKVSEIIDENKWMPRHLAKIQINLSSWRNSKKANPSWKLLSKYGKVVWFIVFHVPYFREETK